MNQVQLTYGTDTEETPFRILLIDDSATRRRVLRDRLDRLGAQIIETGSADSARVHLDALPEFGLPHLILVDERLPGTRGSRFKRELTNSKRYSSIATLVFSAGISPGDYEVDRVVERVSGFAERQARFYELEKKMRSLKKTRRAV